MSLNRLYKEIPVEQRICEGCGESIIRNIAMLDKRLYHYGCLRKSKAKPTHQCLECFSYLTGRGINKVWVDGIAQRTCGNCGSPNLRYLRRRWLE